MASHVTSVSVSNAKAIDYSAVLADLEAKRSAIDSAIAGIRAMMHAGANQSDGAVFQAVSRLSVNGDIPPNAFFRKSIPEAAKLYLQMVQMKQTIKEIADALKRGGMETTSSRFDQTVAAGLNRIVRKDKELVKLPDGKWALAEWVPHMALSKPKKSTTRPVAAKSQPAEALPQRVQNVLNGKPGTVFSPAEIREALGGAISTKDLGSALTRLVKSGRASKVGPAQYKGV